MTYILRRAATFFASRGAKKETWACTEALSKIATVTGSPETLAAVAYALGEAALLENETEQAAQQFGRALELLGRLEAPLQRAETELRAGVALVAAGRRETGIEHLVNAHQTARKMGARPLAANVTKEEVVPQIALGKTNQEIAAELILSARTVDMHVGNILNRLNCRTRAEAVRKAGEQGLLD